MRTLTVVFSILLALTMLVACGGAAPEAPPTAAPQAPAEAPAEAPPPTEAPAEPTEAPAAEATEASTFVYCSRFLAETLDDHAAGANPTGLVAEGLFNQLVDYEPGNTTIVPALAAEWSVSDDATTYTFTMREGVTFHDGTPFDANDVKASYERVIGMESSLAVHLSEVKEMSVPDPMTLVVELKQPFSPFLGGLPEIPIYSAEAIEEHKTDGDEWATEWFVNNAIGTGPYKLDTFRRGERIVLAKNADYWEGWDGPHVDRYVFQLVPEAATQRLQVGSGECHMGDGQLTPEDLEQMAVDPNFQVFEETSVRHFYYLMNYSDSILTDPLVRQAISLAFDRESFCVDVLNNHCQVGRSVLPEALLWDGAPTVPVAKDLEQAAALLDEAGWTDTDGDGVRDKDGQPLVVSLMFLSTHAFQRMGSELLKSDLAEIGLQLELESGPWAQMSERLVTPENRADIFVTSFYASSSSPDSVLWPMFHSDSTHYTNFGFSDPFVDERLDEARATVDEEAQRQLYAEVMEYLHNEVMPAAPMVTVPTSFFATPTVQGFKYQPFDPAIPTLYTMYLEG